MISRHGQGERQGDHEQHDQSAGHDPVGVGLAAVGIGLDGPHDLRHQDGVQHPADQQDVHAGRARRWPRRTCRPAGCRPRTERRAAAAGRSPTTRDTRVPAIMIALAEISRAELAARPAAVAAVVSPWVGLGCRVSGSAQTSVQTSPSDIQRVSILAGSRPAEDRSASVGRPRRPSDRLGRRARTLVALRSLATCRIRSAVVPTSTTPATMAMIQPVVPAWVAFTRIGTGFPSGRPGPGEEFGGDLHRPVRLGPDLDVLGPVGCRPAVAATRPGPP